MKRATIQFSDIAISDILEQAEWYEQAEDRRLVTRWEKAVTSTLTRIRRAPQSGALCRFNASELAGIRRMPVAGFDRHLVFYRYDREVVFVLRVVHGARDLEGLFTT